MKILELTEHREPKVKHLRVRSIESVSPALVQGRPDGTIMVNLIFFVDDEKDTELKDFLESANREYIASTVYKSVEDIISAHDIYHNVKKYTGYTFNPLSGWYEKISPASGTVRWMDRYQGGVVWRLREYFTAISPVEAILKEITNLSSDDECRFIICLESLRHWWD